MYYWRGHQTSPTVVTLKGRLPQILQSKSTLSCEIVQIHSLFCHGFIKKPKSKFNRNRKQTYFVLMQQILVLIWMQMLFKGRYKTQGSLRYFLPLFSVPSFIFSKIGRGLIFTYPQRIVWIIIFIQKMVSLMVILFSTKCFLFVYMYMYIDQIKLKAYKLFEKSDADLSWLLF